MVLVKPTHVENVAFPIELNYKQPHNIKLMECY